MSHQRDPVDPLDFPPPATEGRSGYRFDALKRIFLRTAFLALVFAALPIMPVSSFAPSNRARVTSDGYAPEPISVTVVKVRRETFTSTLVVSGSLIAREEVFVGSELEAATIAEILVEEGDRVTQRQVLARMKSETAKAALDMNEAQIERADAMIAQSDSAIEEAEVAYLLASNIYDRARTLSSSGAASMDALEQRRAGAETARVRLQSARHARNLALAERSLAQAQRRDIFIRLERSEVKAPASGVVVQRLARLGMQVSGDSGPLFRLIQDGTIELEALVPMSDLARFERGLQAEILVAGAAMPVAGQVRLVASRVDVASRMGSVRIAILSEDALRVGAFARARIHLRKPGSLVLPLSTVLFGGDGNYVQVVKDGIVESRTVTVGEYGDGAARIEAGLAEGEHVILTAGAWVHAGERVAARMTTQVVASNR
ncbi:MAG TPA: efflux RND transporter periplasmic adaptor subunit [Pseudorhizobium sp.]|nr:efflux RND transporter periplasmic adaptor subunit [Pseudorhizobium sp.]